MGTTIDYLVIPAEMVAHTFSENCGSSFEREGLTPGGWVFYSGRCKSIDALENLLETASADADDSALVAWIEDSDFAYVATANHGRVVARLLLNPRTADDYREGVEALSKIEGQFGPSSPEDRAAESLAAWSSLAPRQVGAEAVIQILEKEWLFAEEGVGELLEALGLGQPEYRPPAGFEEVGYLWRSGKAWRGRRSIDIAKQRYVRGKGRGFYGIWDRERPGPPIKRFRDTSEGREEVYREWAKLVGLWSWPDELMHKVQRLLLRTRR